MADADLRPMSLGEVLDRTFKLYKNHFWLFAGITALPSGVLLLLRVCNSALQSTWFADAKTPGNAPAVAASAIMVGVLVGMFVGLAYLALVGFAHAASVFAVSDLYLGGVAGLRSAYHRVGVKVFRVLLIFILIGLACGVGFLLLIIPGIIIGCRVALAIPVSMLENANPIRSIERSVELTKGHAMEIFVILLMVVALTYVVAILFQVPFMYVAVKATKDRHAVSFFLLFLMNLSSFVSEVLVGPIGTIALSLMYYNLRVRKEAFDLQYMMATMRPAETAALDASPTV
jgi:hypothetical protein